MDYSLHPITGDYDDLTEAELAALRGSLRRHGLLMPIVVWHGQIVDGRHRARLARRCSLSACT
jgi:ParB-like chromosome segregation protein Spo0J